MEKNKLAPEVVFAFRMFLVKHHLTPADVLKLLVTLETDK